MTKNKKTQRFGLFYRSNGQWNRSPYRGMTFTAYQAKRNPVKSEIFTLKNYVLKSRVKVRPVQAG